MTAPIHRCAEHGFVEARECPACGRPAERVLSGDRRERLSRFLSGALRHFPDDVGIDLDRRGWTDRDGLVIAVGKRYDWAAPEHVDAVIETDPKGRFERRDGRVRAAYGHSVAVDLEGSDAPVPETLYHGTAPLALDAILEEGLRPMDRRQVHLSGSRAGAREVGRRHADDPVVLAVDAAAMHEDGHGIEKRGRETYTTDRVPPEYLSVVE